VNYALLATWVLGGGLLGLMVGFLLGFLAGRVA
jgi:hypothetical protein